MGGCCVFIFAVWFVWLVVRWLRNNWGDAPERSAATKLGLLPGWLPTEDERRIHLPASEVGLPTRIRVLYRRGEVARAAQLSEPGFHYVWYGRDGRLHKQQQGANENLLNPEVTLPFGSVFLVVFDPETLKHAVFVAEGGVRAKAPPPKPVERPRLASSPMAPDALWSVERLMETAAENFHDAERLKVVADRLQELGHPLGEALSMNLSGWATLLPDMVPPGARVLRTMGGFPIDISWERHTDAAHLGWCAVETIHFPPVPQEGWPLARRTPRLRELRNLHWLPELDGLHAQLEVLAFHSLAGTELLAQQLPKLTRLREVHCEYTTMTPEGVVDWFCDVLPSFERFVISKPFAQPEHIDALRQALERHNVSWAVDVTFGLLSEPNRVWLRVSRTSVSLHTTGQHLDRSGLTRARLACGQEFADLPLIEE